LKKPFEELQLYLNVEVVDDDVDDVDVDVVVDVVF